jgi:hypothetical protein
VTTIVATREVRAPASELWAVLVDWPRHGAWVPFTSMSVDDRGGQEVGSTFVGRTAVGPVGFDDPMRVTEWRPPTATGTGIVRISHEGNLIGGTAYVEVRPVTSGRCVATWHEAMVLLPRLPAGLARVVRALAGPPSSFGGRIIFGRVLRKAADQVEQAYAITQAERR